MLVSNPKWRRNIPEMISWGHPSNHGLQSVISWRWTAKILLLVAVAQVPVCLQPGTRRPAYSKNIHTHWTCDWTFPPSWLTHVSLQTSNQTKLVVSIVSIGLVYRQSNIIGRFLSLCQTSEAVSVSHWHGLGLPWGVPECRGNLWKITIIFFRENMGKYGFNPTDQKWEISRFCFVSHLWFQVLVISTPVEW